MDSLGCHDLGASNGRLRGYGRNAAAPGRSASGWQDRHLRLFTARLDGETLTINAEGRARVLHVTQPPIIVRPQCCVDGQEWMACWTDYPASGWGSYDNTWLIGSAVPDGKHELVVKNMTYPAPWPRQLEVLINVAEAA